MLLLCVGDLVLTRSLLLLLLLLRMLQNSRNVLVSSSASAEGGMVAKLADLGLSRVLQQHKTHRTTQTVGEHFWRLLLLLQPLASACLSLAAHILALTCKVAATAPLVSFNTCVVAAVTV
jgi:hypothetical protein